MVEYLPSKQATWVRFPSPALGTPLGRLGVGAGVTECGAHSRSSRESEWGVPRRGERQESRDSAVAQLVERVLGKDEVLGSNPSGSF